MSAQKIYMTEERVERATKVKDLVEKLYPLCFKGEEAEPMPLKKDINKDIRKLREQYPNIIANKSIEHFLTIYTLSEAYLKNFYAPDAVRIDLDGNTVEPISDEDKRFAKKHAKKIIFGENPKAAPSKPTTSHED